MPKTRIRMATIGHMPINLEIGSVVKWKSSLFEIVENIENYSLSINSDRGDWKYTDIAISNRLPASGGCDFMIAIVNVPLEGNWYTRRLDKNRVVFSYHEINEILASSNIPLENAIYRLLYAYSLVYRSHGNRIPSADEQTNFTHDETKGCLFDMNAIKSNIAHSCHRPIICSECVAKLSQNKVSNDAIHCAQEEIQKIQKTLFYRMAGFIRQHPICSIFISSFAAIVLGAVGSILGTYIYEALRNGM